MPPDEQPANPTRLDYNRGILDACYRALATIVKAIDGQNFPRLVVIGGLAPTLLLDNEHIDELFNDELHPERMTSICACKLSSPTMRHSTLRCSVL